tara:strand:- start:4637 stop:4753 length:117 start_codon:yes stop_codon:yes gene_type:complete
MELDFVNTLVKANEELVENSKQDSALSDLVNSKEMILH